MNKIKLLVLLIPVAFSMSAQLTVNQWGQTRVGNNCDSQFNGNSFYEMYRDTLSSLWVSGPDVNGNPARIIFGDAYLGRYRTVDIGEWYDNSGDEPINTNILHLHGANGVRLTKGTFAGTTLMEYVPGGGNMFNFNVSIKAPAFVVNSDVRYKKDVRPLNNSLDALTQLTGVSYTLKSDKEIYEMKGISVPEDEVVDSIFSVLEQRDRELEKQNSRRFGLLAQEVQAIFPELVREDAEGYLSVDYIGLIPLLINAVNELNDEMQELRNENASLLKQLNIENEAVGEPQSNSLVNTARLYQNIPNPFSATTNIRCALPETVSQAQVLVFDLQGKLLRTIDVPERGISSVTIDACEFPAGMYIYTLLADGEEIATKRMILTK